MTERPLREVGAELGVSGETARRRYRQAQEPGVNDLEAPDPEDDLDRGEPE